MEKQRRKWGLTGIAFVIGFAIWTFLIQKFDVRALGVNGTQIGFGVLLVKGRIIK